MKYLFCRCVFFTFGLILLDGWGNAGEPTVFYVPDDVRKVNGQFAESNFRGSLLVGKAAQAQLFGGNGTCFLEPGARVSVRGGVWAIVVKNGAVVDQVGGGRVHIYWQNPAGPHNRFFGAVTEDKFDSIEFAPFRPFTLKGSVRGAGGAAQPGIKVRIYGLDGEQMAEAVTDDKGAFSFRPPRQVRCLAADLGSIWYRKSPFAEGLDLEMRRRASILYDWQIEFRDGFWGKDALVSVVADRRGGVTLPVPQRLLGHELPIQRLAFSPDGSVLASISTAYRPCLWDAKTGQRLGRIFLPRSEPWIPMEARHSFAMGGAFALGSFGKALAFSGFDIPFGLWDATTGAMNRDLPGHKERVGRPEARCAVFAPDGRTLASGGLDGTIRLWDASTGPTRCIIDTNSAGVLGLAFSPDGRTIVSAGAVVRENPPRVAVEARGTVRAWDTTTGAAVRSFDGEVSRLTFSADGRRLAGAGFTTRIDHLPNNGIRIGPDPRLYVWDRTSGWPLLKAHEQADALALTRDGRLLLTATAESLRLWEVDTGQEILTCPFPVKDIVQVALSTDGGALALGGRDGAVYLWPIRAHHLYVPAPRRRSDTEWQGLWNDLAADRAAAAYRALWTLLHQPARAVALLRDRLRPSPVLHLPLDKWIADLNSDEFPTRQKSRSLAPRCRCAGGTRLAAGAESEALAGSAQAHRAAFGRNRTASPDGGGAAFAAGD